MLLSKPTAFHRVLLNSSFCGAPLHLFPVPFLTPDLITLINREITRCLLKHFQATTNLKVTPTHFSPTISLFFFFLDGGDQIHEILQTNVKYVMYRYLLHGIAVLMSAFFTRFFCMRPLIKISI